MFTSSTLTALLYAVNVDKLQEKQLNSLLVNGIIFIMARLEPNIKIKWKNSFM